MSANTQPSAAHGSFDDGSWLKLGLYCAACGKWVSQDDEKGHHAVRLPPRLWLYTNYDCNLQCRYCLVSSSPYAERRALSVETFRALVDEAVALGVQEIFLTGGEPFLLPDIYEMIAHACARTRVTVLSNAMIIRGKRLEQLCAVNSPRLFIQVSVDDVEPGVHDAYRGDGAWEKTMEGIKLLRSNGVQVRVATTVTPELEPRVDAVRRFVQGVLGVPEEHHIVRPLLRRGFSDEGLEVGKENLMPELTVDAGGIYWHPSGTDTDLLVTSDTRSLRNALEEVARLTLAKASGGQLQAFR
ncbi:MAG: radical SAM protein [Myxococcota bacterium]